MKIRTIITAAATGLVLTVAGSGLAFGATDNWVCPRGYEGCESYEYCTTHDHGDCEGYWSEDGSWNCQDGNHCGNRPARTNSGHGHHGRGCGSHHR